MNSLAKKAMLTTLETGAWRATKLHASETAKVNADHQATDIAKVSVKLTNHPALVALGKLHAAARAEHYRLTLPAATDGFRFMPCGRELEHSAIMQKFATEHEALVQEFLGAYDVERATAPARLNGLYDPKHWPVTVAGRFKFQTRYMPVPEAGTWQDWLKESAEDAEAELKERLADAIRSFRDKLKDPKAIFRDSLVSNLHDICELAGDLNILDDPAIKAISQQAAELSKHTPSTLRDDQQTRAQAAERAANICASFKL